MQGVSLAPILSLFSQNCLLTSLVFVIYLGTFPVRTFQKKG
ncbi:hypothetical protein ARMA_1750 [Ardenticatena maritima]|uniref:Uncharacterized protein n=1 Tax=Ardenticatena maritima TaxID=872965 RepID=A0A0N0RFN2_9CHLR|nr:hypothetical protein ARMA_1750 [Ardenticatena maritima]